MNEPSAGSRRPSPEAQSVQRNWIERFHGHSWDEMRRFPKHVDIEVVNTCNARCTMCGIDFDRRQAARMDDALFARIVAQLVPYRDHLVRVGLVVNAEPLMDRRLAERVACLKNSGIRVVSVITNAALLSSRRASELLQAGVDRVYLSLDSLDAEVFERIRRGLRFEQVYGNIIEFLRLRSTLRPTTRVRVTMVQSDLNVGEGESFRQHWRRHLAPGDEIVVTRAYDWGHVHGFDDDERAALENARPCAGLWTSFNIDVDGQVRMCCADEAGATSLGDLRQQTIAEVWQAAELARIQELHLSGRRREIAMCDGCAIWAPDKHLIHDRIA